MFVDKRHVTINITFINDFAKIIKTEKMVFMKYYCFISSLIGSLRLVQEDNCICEISLQKDAVKNAQQKTTPILENAVRQLLEYFSGQRMIFELPIIEQGTAFQCAVWQGLRKIPYGQTRSYSQLAHDIGKAGACLAVGQANNRNPLLIVTPCHRAIGADGGLVGFAAGLEVKRFLLNMEKQYLHW